MSYIRQRTTEQHPNKQHAMLKTAIFSDIHGNLQALEAILKDAKEQGVQNFACLGDVVGYGPSPADCISKIQEIGCVCIKGNHDDDASTERDLSNLSDNAQVSLKWTRDRLSSAQKEWLRRLPMQKRLGRNMLVHSSLKNPHSWEYIRNKFDAEAAISSQPTPLCFFGHTHKPVCYEQTTNGVSIVDEQKIGINPDYKYLINVGSVGQPRDGNPDASYVIFNRTSREISFRRVQYDVSSVVDEIYASGLDPELAQRLIEAV